MVAVAVRGLVWIDLHAADRVEGGRGFGTVRVRSVFHFRFDLKRVPGRGI